MSAIVEIGRFFLTAVAVGLVMPILFMMMALAETGELLLGIYLFAAMISFAFAIVGGVVFGLPSLWVARRIRWDRSLVRMTALGAAVGGAGTNFLIFLLGSNEPSSIPLWALYGALAGTVAAPVWVLLHRDDVLIPVS